MATGSIIVNEFCIIQVIEIIRTILPLRKCYGLENRGRVGIINKNPETRLNSEFRGFLFAFDYVLTIFIINQLTIWVIVEALIQVVQYQLYSLDDCSIQLN